MVGSCWLFVVSCWLLVVGCWWLDRRGAGGLYGGVTMFLKIAANLRRRSGNLDRFTFCEHREQNIAKEIEPRAVASVSARVSAAAATMVAFFMSPLIV